MEDYRFYLDRLNMMAHPEGGFYRRNWQSLLSGDLKDTTGKIVFASRPVGSSILYLLPSSMVCKWHRVKCDEMWHFYQGVALRMYSLTPQNGLEIQVLGTDIAHGELPQIIIPRNTWIAAELAEDHDFSLCGCTLWPAFSYTDFELAEPAALADDFPAHRDIIERIQHHSQ